MGKLSIAPVTAYYSPSQPLRYSVALMVPIPARKVNVAVILLNSVLIRLCITAARSPVAAKVGSSGLARVNWFHLALVLSRFLATSS
ncbi:MAG: hypothetical protein N2512_08460 [Armatimonadetes bacterium]|nr:hypothetical protein [Armatimonadota bacterium]